MPQKLQTLPPAAFVPAAAAPMFLGLAPTWFWITDLNISPRLAIAAVSASILAVFGSGGLGVTTVLRFAAATGAKTGAAWGAAAVPSRM